MSLLGCWVGASSLSFSAGIQPHQCRNNISTSYHYSQGSRQGAFISCTLDLGMCPPCSTSHQHGCGRQGLLNGQAQPSAVLLATNTG